MSDYRIPFIGRGHAYTDEEIQVAVEAMTNAIPLSQGEYQEYFQEKFCQLTGAKHAFALNNATSALELSAQICQFEPGDEVIIPAHTFTASAYPFLKNGAKIVWADIDLSTRVVTVETIQCCITPNTKAIVVVHLYGFAANMPAIMDLANQNNLLVIEDAAQAMGVEIEGKSVGTFANFGVFSFHSHKNISTLGEGGMLTVKDDQIASIIPMMRHNGHCSFDYKRDQYWVPAMGNVDLPALNNEILWPNNYCLGEVECAVGAKLLDRLREMNDKRRQRAMKFIDSLNEFSDLIFHRENTSRHNYHLLVAQLINGKRDVFIQKMATEEGVQCVVQYYPLYSYDLYKKANQGEANCPNTEEFYSQMVSFPFHHMMEDGEFEWMIKASKKVMTSLGRI
jgi:dTDP-4-amino-4,6-dideoxygalactose transaminase